MPLLYKSKYLRLYSGIGGGNMKKLTIEEKIILQIALANFIQSRQDAKENSYIPREYLDRDIKIAQDLQEKITYFID